MSNKCKSLAALAVGAILATTVAPAAHADDPYDVCHGTQWFTNCRNPVPPPPPPNAPEPDWQKDNDATIARCQAQGHCS